MELISITSNAEDYIDGYLMNNNVYVIFACEKGEDIVFIKEIPKSLYTSYDHFAMVQGKFDGFTMFFVNPVPIEEETFEGIKKAYQKHLNTLKGRQ